MADLGFWAIAADEPEHLALVEADGTERSAGDLLAAANQISRGLQALGLQRGDVVSAVLPNRREMVELNLAATQIGLYLTPINYHLTGPEIAYIVENAEAKAFVVSDRYANACTAAANELGFDDKARFSVGPVDGFRPYEELKAAYDMSAWRQVIHAAAPCPVEVKRRMLEWWGPVIYEYYAATEGGGTIVTPEEWLKKPGTVGKAWAISEVKILDDDGNEVPTGG